LERFLLDFYLTDWIGALGKLLVSRRWCRWAEYVVEFGGYRKVNKKARVSMVLTLAYVDPGI